MDTGLEALPDDVEALKAALLATRAELAHVRADAAVSQAKASEDQALIAHLKLSIEKLKRELRGRRSERSSRLLDQMELQLEELETSATEDELAAEAAMARTTQVAAFVRKRPARKPFPEHLPRERVIVPGPCACEACGGTRLSKLGEDVTETLEVIPRGWAGPSLLAMILFEKFGQHQPLNRQAERYALEGVPLSLSTLADQVSACTHVLRPLFERLEAHVLAAQRLHADDTPVPVLAKGKTDTGRLWVYVRDDQPFGGQDPLAAIFYYSRDRRGAHPQAHLATWSGILQADAYGGYGELYRPDRQAGAVLEAGCWAHSRRKFFELAVIEQAAHRRAKGKTPLVISPLALEALRRIDALFDIERQLRGLPPAERLAARQAQCASLVADLEVWMRQRRAELSRSNPVAKAMDYMLTRWPSFARFLNDGHICLTNNAAERALRGIALGRKAWLFCGSDRGGDRAAVIYSLIVSAKLSGVDPQAWLADVLARIADHPAHQIDQLLPWNWRHTAQQASAA